MKRSTERILTTHTGSLPRPGELARLMLASARDEVVDAALLDEIVHESVIAIARRQVELGIDVISDGEMSKIGFANYVKDRLTGFGGQSNSWIGQDILDHPEVRARLYGSQGEMSAAILLPPAPARLSCATRRPFIVILPICRRLCERSSPWMFLFLPLRLERLPM